MDTTSRHKIGDTVIVDLFTCGKFLGTIGAVKYTDYGKVLYDVNVRPFEDDEEYVFAFKDIDSYFIKTEYDDIVGIKK